MSRPVTLFTGQWADLPFADLGRKVKDFGYDGMELACWGDHFEVDKALEDDGYCQRKREQLESLDLQCLAISNHLVGQAVLDVIDERHKAILPDYVWGDGDPAGVNATRADEEMNSHGPCGSEVWRERGQRVHRFQYLASALLFPAGFRIDD